MLAWFKRKNFPIKWHEKEYYMYPEGAGDWNDLLGILVASFE